MAAARSTPNGQSDELDLMKNAMDNNLLQISAFSGEMMDALGKASCNINSGVVKVQGGVNTVVHQTSVIRTQTMVINQIQGAVAGIANNLQQVKEDTAAGLQGASDKLQQILEGLSQLLGSISTLHRRLDHVEEVLMDIQAHMSTV